MYNNDISSERRITSPASKKPPIFSELYKTNFITLVPAIPSLKWFTKGQMRRTPIWDWHWRGEEIDALNRIVSMWLDFADEFAQKRINCKGCNSTVIIHSISVSAWIVTMANAIWGFILSIWVLPIPLRISFTVVAEDWYGVGPPSGVNTGPVKRRKYWAHQAG